jgi:carbonic anhydrase/acetyltransferase-like protein (isoleucine patch superfamily)
MTRVVLHPSSLLLGRVEFAGRAEVGPYVVIGGPTYQESQRREATKEHAGSVTTVLGDNFTLHAYSCVGAGAIIGNDFRGDAHSYVGSNAKLGNRVVVEYGGRVYNDAVIGDNSYIGGFVCNGARVGTGCAIFGALVHRRTAPEPEPAPVICNGVLIGFHAVIAGGIIVGEGGVIAAGAVVITDTEPGSMYAGVPARKVGPASWI